MLWYMCLLFVQSWLSHYGYLITIDSVFLFLPKWTNWSPCFAAQISPIKLILILNFGTLTLWLVAVLDKFKNVSCAFHRFKCGTLEKWSTTFYWRQTGKKGSVPFAFRQYVFLLPHIQDIPKLIRYMFFCCFCFLCGNWRFHFRKRKKKWQANICEE